MSLKSWKNEFSDTLSLLKLSRLKWIGLRAANLAKHDCEVFSSSCVIKSANDTHNLSSDDLCKHFEQCEKCPLKLFLGRSCDDGESSPWELFWKNEDPEPMIKALEGAIDVAKNLEK